MITSHTYKLSAYPKDVPLTNGVVAVLKPMTPIDATALLDFFLTTPEENRYYLKDDVTSPTVIQQWAEELDYDRTLPLLACVDGKVVADGTLHRTRILARRHVGFVKVAALPGHGKDQDGHPRDIIPMEMMLGSWFDWWSF